MSAWAAFWLFLTALSLSFGVVPIIEALRTWRDEGLQRKDDARDHWVRLWERERRERLAAELRLKAYYQELQNQRRGLRRLRKRALKAEALSRTTPEGTP